MRRKWLEDLSHNWNSERVPYHMFASGWVQPLDLRITWRKSEQPGHARFDGAQPRHCLRHLFRQPRDGRRLGNLYLRPRATLRDGGGQQSSLSLCVLETELVADSSARRAAPR
eukprot:COSAG01_NODE_34653_length_544_cov_0.768539_1_plen_113_part_00